MARDLSNRIQQQNQMATRPQGGAVATQGGPEGAIKAMTTEFQRAMPRGGEAAQLVRDAITVVRQTPKLAECEPNSLLGSLMTCAQLGLRPGISALGHAYILPFFNGKTKKMEAQFVIGYQGMLELGNRSGEIDYLTAEMVCENDLFKADPMGGRHRHEYPDRGRRGKVIGYYSIFFRKGSERGKLLYMSKEDMEDHRDKFATAKNRKTGQIFGPWVDHFDAMALKTVVRMNFKYMPKNTTIENALIADESVRVDVDPHADLNQVAKELPNQEGTHPGEIMDEPVDTATGELNPQQQAEPSYPGEPSQEEKDAIFAAEMAGR